ncbi:hypothetical protein [Lentzea sp. CA-135723]|uniref:hypothetical protein n=1 Tax=Lentzea sp. CA-135723 TaxID=3239950 RepID=UPI003D8FD747
MGPGAAFGGGEGVRAVLGPLVVARRDGENTDAGSAIINGVRTAGSVSRPREGSPFTK